MITLICKRFSKNQIWYNKNMQSPSWDQCPIHWVLHKSRHTSWSLWPIHLLCKWDINFQNESSTHQNPSMRSTTVTKHSKHLFDSLNQQQNIRRNTTQNKLQLRSGYFVYISHKIAQLKDKRQDSEWKYYKYCFVFISLKPNTSKCMQ